MPVQEIRIDPNTGEIIDEQGDPGPSEQDAAGVADDETTGGIGTGEDRGEADDGAAEAESAAEAELRAKLAEIQAAKEKAKADAAAKAKAAADAAKKAEKPAGKPAQPAPAAKTAVTTTGAPPVVTGELADYMPTGAPAEREHLSSLFAQHRGRGIDFRQQDLAIPRLYLLQDMSEQVKERSAAYVPGARPGMWFNTVTNELSPGFLGIPIKYARRYVGWYPREENGGGGGLARMDIPEAEFLTMEESGIGVRTYLQTDPKGKEKVAEAVETPEWIILLLRRPPLIHIPVALSFPKTKSKVSGQLNAILAMQVDYLEDGTEYTLPSFANVIKFAARVEGEGPQSYFVPTVEYVARVTRADLFNRCANIFDQFDAGTAHVVGVEGAA